MDKTFLKLLNGRVEDRTVLYIFEVSSLVLRARLAYRGLSFLVCLSYFFFHKIIYQSLALVNSFHLLFCLFEPEI